MPRSLPGALLFAFSCALISSAMAELVTLTGISGGWLGLQAAFEAVMLAGALGLGLLLAVSGVIHLLVRLMAGSGRRGFGTTLRVACYASVVELASWVPFAGWVFELYFFYLLLVGVRETHRTSEDRALLIALVPLLLVFLSLIAVSLIGIRGAFGV